jgi:hypothetical protein
VDIPQEGDVNKVWKTEATRALPGLVVPDDPRHGDERVEKPNGRYTESRH